MILKEKTSNENILKNVNKSVSFVVTLSLLNCLVLDIIFHRLAYDFLVQDSSAVQWFVRLPGAVGCQSTLHKENSVFATPTLGWHISMFRGYQIYVSIRKPYINCFTNHFSIHS